MARSLIYTDTRFEKLAGYARAVIEDDWVFVSGVAGYDFADDSISDDAVEQTRQCLRTIEDTLAKAGSGLDRIARMRVYLAGREHIVPVSRAIAERLGESRYANTTTICTLAMPEMLVELEVTARKR